MGSDVTPPLPAGFKLDDAPPPPPGFKLDGKSDKPKETFTQFEARTKKSIADAPYDVGGQATDWASQHLPPWAAAGVGTAANLGMHIAPMLMGAGSGKAVQMPLEAAGKGLMRSAIKPALGDLERGKVEPAIRTMLEQGYNPTNSGVAAMREKAGGYLDAADRILQPSNKLVNVEKAEQNLQSLADRVGPGTRGPSKIQDLNAAAAELRAHPAVDDLGLMSVQDAQAMKQANYKDIGPNAYGLNVKEQTARDALKAQTAALRKGIEEAEPGVVPLNEKAGELLNAAKVSQRRALMEGNKDPLPFGASVATAMNNPVAALGMYANSSAAVKAMLARMLYSSGQAAPAIGTAAGAGFDARPEDTRKALIEALGK